MDLGKLFGRQKKAPDTLASLEKLGETLEMLEKKEKVYEKKIAAEMEKAKEFTKAKNRKAAIQCLKRKKMYETQIESLTNFELRIQDQMILLEGSNATAATVKALQEGAQALQGTLQAMKIEDLDRTMDEIMDATDQIKTVQDTLGQPIGEYNFDEDDLEAELNGLEAEDLEEQLLQPTHTAPAASTPSAVPSSSRPAQAARPAPRRTKEEEELEALQADMAM
eukprot:TRINITY_DN22222_c0_g1_i1.p1 TRINITY_DN22222_c0_g1~~TRINITY_DN22222_c0_g1_i1.p1  ORF type:complete len:223 (+),score=75.11 TRINITY_DN22222_c0_g1_i1:168-836(+)